MANITKRERVKALAKRYGNAGLGAARGQLKEETSPTNLLIELAGNAAVTVATRKLMQAKPDFPVPLDVGATVISVVAMAFTKKGDRRFARQAFRASAHALASRIAGSATSIKVTQGPDGQPVVEMG